MHIGMWGLHTIELGLHIPRMSLLKRALGLHERASWMHPHKFHWRAFLSSYVHLLHGNTYSSHHIYHLAFSPIIVLIDVSLSHLFVFLLHHISLFAVLSVNSRGYSYPLHECSKYLKGVDHIDLYLASGLGTSQDKIPKKTKRETIVD